MPLFLAIYRTPSIVLNPIPLSLYIHIPWCVKKCPYCDFNSHEKNKSFDEKKYIKALLADMDMEYRHCQNRTIKSIFFGGGTPSLFSAESIQRIISHAKKLFAFENIEITLEANPGTFEQEKFSAFHDAGINRLSIGIQSFNDDHLRSLGRIHDSQQALVAIETAGAAGFDNINLDLMFGLPGQSVQQAIDDITTACRFDVTHISHYQLTIEPNTFFYKHKPSLPDSELIWDMQTHCQILLSENQYSQYEISAYAKPGKTCEHNLNYWNFADYIGIGAGAHGKITHKSDDRLNINRRWKHRQPQQYIEHCLNDSAVSGEQLLDERDIVFEFLLNTLRLKDGSDTANFNLCTGLASDKLKSAVRDIDTSLLSIDKNRIKTTDKGYLFLNDVLENLL